MRKRIGSFSLAALLGLAVATASAALLSAPAMYADALAKEQAVREAIGTGQPAVAVLKAVRTVVVRRRRVLQFRRRSTERAMQWR